MTFWGHLSVDYNLVEYQLMTFWGRLSVRNIGLWPFWGHLSLWNNSLWPSEVVCLCGILDYDLFEVICPCGIPAYDLPRSFVCAGYQLMTFWGRLSVRNIGLWPFWGHLSVDYNLFEVVCPCGITAYDLLRSFVCVITTFLRLFVLLEYQLMTFVSVWDTRSWPSEVVCLCGLPAHGLLRSFVCAGYRITTFFEVVCPCGIPSLWPSEVICLWITTLWNTSLWPSEVVCLCGISDYDLFEVVLSFWKYQLMTFWGRLSVRNIGLRPF